MLATARANPRELGAAGFAEFGAEVILLLAARAAHRASLLLRALQYKETVRAFKEILDGKHDSVAEGDFYMKGAIEEITQK